MNPVVIARQLCLVASVLCVLDASANAQHCPVDGGFQGNYNFGKKAKSFTGVRRLSEISAPVVARINEQLTSRVGKQFFNKLRFDYGTVDDWDDVRPLSPNDSERIDAYDFVFKFSDGRKGLKAFHFKVVADKLGDLVDTLALPDIAANAQKGNIIPCERARRIAARHDFPLRRSSIYFMYDDDTANFAWEIVDDKPVAPDETDEPTLLPGQGTYRHVLIDANTGSVLRIYKETIIVRYTFPRKSLVAVGLAGTIRSSGVLGRAQAAG